MVLSASSADFFVVRACTLPLADFPSVDSAAIRCKSRKAILKGACVCGGGTAAAGGGAGVCANAVALKINTLHTAATENLII